MIKQLSTNLLKNVYNKCNCKQTQFVVVATAMLQNQLLYNHKANLLNCYLTTRIKYHFSKGQIKKSVKNDSLRYSQTGFLNIRNSETLELQISIKGGQKSVTLAKDLSIDQATQQCKKQLSIETIKFFCDKRLPISPAVPLQALLNQIFYLWVGQNNFLKLQGTLLTVVDQRTDLQIFENMDLPLITKMQIMKYWSRVKTMIEAKHGPIMNSRSVKIKQKDAKNIMVQALLSDNHPTRYLLIQEKFKEVYWETKELREKKNQALRQCRKMVKARMSLGLVLLLGNVGFVWSGTYIFLSWDIVEPLAYFITSGAGIILFSRFFKLKRPFSLVSYRQYLTERHLPAAMKKVNFDPTVLQQKERILLELESELKDFYLRKI